MSPSNPSPLAPQDFEALLSLSSGPRHGYGIIADIRERTEGRVVIGTSSLYAIIRRLVRDGLVADAGDQPAEGAKGPPRRYYRITEAGLGVLRQETERMRRALSSAEAILEASHARAEE